ncbi:MAG: ATP-binding protein [Sutterellaceae bacterium]|nr:ATP-binding protein [Sutterellaceae bacterium]
MSKWLRISFYLIAVAGVALLIALAAGGANSSDFERYFPVLLIVNIFATLSLFIFIVAIVFRMVKRLKNGVYGSRMTATLALVLAVSAIVPCLLIYLVSSQFIGRSIDSWFDVRIEEALDSGVALSGGVIDREQKSLRQAALRIASILNVTSDTDKTLALDRMRETADAASAIVFSEDGTIQLSSFSPMAPTIIDRPTFSQFTKATDENGIYLLEGDQAGTEELLRIRAIVPLGRLTKPKTFLQLTQFVPKEVAEHTQDLIQGYRNYQELVLTREALRNIYTVTLTLTMVLAVLVAISVALSFARSITAPVLQLAAGTRKVAEGDLRPIKEFAGKSEINALTRSFNSMVAQIADARQIVENQRINAEHARAQLERILENLSSGVLVTDNRFTVLMFNSATNSILKFNAISEGSSLIEASPDLARALDEEIQVTTDDTDIRFELEVTRPDLTAPISLYIRAAKTDLEKGSGWVIVFDDISPVLDAQRAVAWGEVARRLAHEIKNPLTPIRLAAERLEFKLADKLDEHDAALLKRTSNTIVTQVDALKQMVNDFRDFAKLPTASLKPANLADIIAEAVELYASGGTHVDIKIDSDLPMILADSAQLKQVLHNLIGNAIDSTAEVKKPEISLSVVKVAKTSGLVRTVRMILEDNGPGFTPSILAHAFEPYVTTKPTGTGLGLPMVKKIIEEHHAKITLSNKTDMHDNVLGARVVVIFPVPSSLSDEAGSES